MDRILCLMKVKIYFSIFFFLFLINLLLSRPGIYLRELQNKLCMQFGIVIHLSTICRGLRKLGLTYQKLQHIALQQSEPEGIKFIAEVMSVFPNTMILWIDETAGLRS